MRNICLTIAYAGTHYGGWQRQKNARTVQGEIEKALRKILEKKTRLIASGRTDSGVHAKAQVANFETEKDISLEKLQAALNAKLPNDISIVKIKYVPLKFHSQFDAKTKLYRYTILNSRIDDPFARAYYNKVPQRLDISLMRRASKVLEGEHDFKSFQAKSALSDKKETIRTIKRINIRRDKAFLYIDIEANGFLHNMVRNIAGTLIEIGRGFLPAGSMKEILTSRNRQKAGPTAPPEGLTLVKVKY